HLDVVVANVCRAVGDCLAGSAGVLLGNGDGTFAPVTAYSANGTNSVQVVLSDVNGDGKPDLLMSNLYGSCVGCTGSGVDVFLGNGDGTFQAAVTYGSLKLPTYFAIADLNGDGKADIVVNSCGFASCTTGADSILSVFLGYGDGTFQAPV